MPLTARRQGPQVILSALRPSLSVQGRTSSRRAVAALPSPCPTTSICSSHTQSPQLPLRCPKLLPQSAVGTSAHYAKARRITDAMSPMAQRRPGDPCTNWPTTVALWPGAPSPATSEAGEEKGGRAWWLAAALCCINGLATVSAQSVRESRPFLAHRMPVYSSIAAISHPTLEQQHHPRQTGTVRRTD
jgi:hypothetical protein